MKISAKELRIGNLLYTLEDKLTNVTDIIVDKDFEADYFWCYGYNEGEIKPIPLTEQWLIDLGFYKATDMTWYNSKPTEFNLPRLKLQNFRDMGNEDIPMLLDDKYGTHLKYVHSLQNLYFALTGEELTKK